jgi:hypothetical protein
MEVLQARHSELLFLNILGGSRALTNTIHEKKRAKLITDSTTTQSSKANIVIFSQQQIAATYSVYAVWTKKHSGQPPSKHISMDTEDNHSEPTATEITTTAQA